MNRRAPLPGSRQRGNPSTTAAIERAAAEVPTRPPSCGAPTTQVIEVPQGQRVDPDALEGTSGDRVDLRFGGRQRQTRQVDQERARWAVREFLFAIGEDPDREGLLDTPDRVARAATQLFAGLSQEPVDVLSARFSIEHDELIIVRDIEIFSTCEHHLLPFHGVAHVGYIPAPDGTVTGLSKLARLVDVFARRPQVQGADHDPVADALVEHLGARAPSSSSRPRPMHALPCAECTARSRTITSAVRGASCATPPPGAERCRSCSVAKR